MKRIICIFFWCLLLVQGTSAQQIDLKNYAAKYNSIAYEKVYVHTDRKNYTVKEDIWFKIYLLDGKTHLLEKGQNNVYVDLVDQHGHVLAHKPWLSQDGLADGFIHIPATVTTGTYTIRAYTSYLKHFGDAALFQKEINICQLRLDEHRNVVGQIPKPSRAKTTARGRKISVQFMPEGGYLCSGLSNTLAFKVTTPDGKGTNQRGVVLNHKGEFVDSLVCSHRGMGKLSLTPREHSRYVAVLNHFPNDTFALPPAMVLPQLQYLGIQNLAANFRLSPAHGQTEPQHYHLIVKAHGQVLYYLKKQLHSQADTFDFPVHQLAKGLNQLVLVNQDLVPIAERVFYVPGKSNAQLQLRTEQKTYKTRSKTNVELQLVDEADINASGSFSLSVVNLEQAANDIPASNIHAYLELEAEIRGKIEQPAYYFTNPWDSIKAPLDLLLLVQAWRQYCWNDSVVDALPHKPYSKEPGLALRGKAKRLWSKKGLKDGQISLLVPEYAIKLDTTTQTDGQFCFDHLVLYDSAQVVVKARNRKGRKNTELLNFEYEIPSAPAFSPIQPLSDSLEQAKYLANAYERFANDSYLNLDETAILLDEISVTAKRVEEVSVFENQYGFAERSLAVDPDEITRYTNVFDYVQSNVPGFTYFNNDLNMRQGGIAGRPVVLVDDAEVEPYVAEQIPVQMIEKILVSKSPDVRSMLVSDSTNLFGAIAIYTRSGYVYRNPYENLDRIIKNVEGYARHRKFYAPDYSLPDEKLNLRDLRATIFWAPNVQPDKTGKCNISFFNSDNKGKTAIIVEGMLHNGKAGRAQTVYQVR